MPLYRFYRIVSTEGPEEYIGSTIQTLSERFSGHKSGYKQGQSCSSRHLFIKYGVETCSIILISEQEMEKADALREERRLYDEYREHIVNRLRPCVSKDETRQLRQQYYEEKKEYYDEQNRRYRDKHKEEAKRYNAQYRIENKEALNTYYAEKISCDICGKIVARANVARHKRIKSCLSKKIDE